tara:strand:- start:866 stop:1243 length:378 start_codon:yes stop_codon:yes gene_type:complete
MLDNLLLNINNSKLFAGLIMIMMNISGKYIVKDIPIHVDKFLSTKIFRPIAVFCVAFIATRDIKLSVLITLIFILFFRFLLDGNSKACILPKEYINLDFNNDGIITRDELDKAQEIINKYRQQIK